MAFRSRPDVNDLKWIGDIAVVTDLGQPNADILTEQLREQPEVAYAQPNYLRHLDSVPNDPSYPSKQWDMAALDMPRAWDINGGADGIIVAVVDIRRDELQPDDRRAGCGTARLSSTYSGAVHRESRLAVESSGAAAGTS